VPYDRERVQRLILGGFVGVGAVAGVAALKYALASTLGERAAFIPFVIPVMIAGWYGGLWPALLTTLAGAAITTYCFVPPEFSFQIARLSDVLSLGIFVAGGATISGLCEALHATRRRDEQRRQHLDVAIEQCRAAEQSVQASERRLKEAHEHVVTALEGMTDGFHRFDGDWRYTYVNAAAELLFGRPRNDVLGKPLWEASPELLGTRVEKEYRRAIAEQMVVAWEHFDEDRGRWLSIRAFPTADGGLASFFHDVTHQRQAADNLRESQRQEHARRIELEAVMASAPAAIWIAHDPQCDQITGNSAACAMLRILPESNMAKTAEDVPRQFQVFRDNRSLRDDDLPLQVATRTGRPTERQELEFRFSDGTSVWAYGNAQPLFDERGAVRGGIASFIDITSRRQAEKRLRQSEHLYRAIGESIPYGVWVCDADGRNIYASPAFLKLVGLTQEQYSEFGWSEALHGDDAASTLAAWKECVRQRGTWDMEHRLKGVDGNWHPVLARGAPILDDQGRVVCWAGINLDISSLRLAEEALRTAEDQLRVVTDTMSAPVTRCGRDFRYLWVSRPYAAFLERAPEEILGRTIAEVMGQEAFDRLLPRFERVLAGHTLQYEEEVNYRGIGRRWISASYTPTFAANGTVTGWVAVVIDISERKRVENALKEADRRKNEFLATLAHELRNPLAPIRNAVQILKVKGPSEDQLNWGRDMIDRQVVQMARLLDDLLDISRITRNKLELRKERVALSSVIESAVETSRPLIEACGHELAIDLPAEPIYLEADPMRLAQVVWNLLNNAAKYTDRGGRISLAARRQGSEVSISIADNGIGIESEMLPQLFEIFSQVAPASERSQGGLGIGLSLVRGLVEIHGGSIEAHSDGPGQGSQFTVRLPLVVETVSPKMPPVAHSVLAVQGSGRRILVVDDNRDSADSLGTLLRVQGYDVHTAYDGQAAIEAAEILRPDVVLLDLGMPRLNGYEAARHLRQQPWGRDLTLIALTGWGQDEDRQRTREAGFDQHFVKPVDPAELLQLLSEPQPSAV
jgi:PAS domain S-box-containing protein